MAMLNLKSSVKPLWEIVGKYFGYRKPRTVSDENADLLSAFREFNSKVTRYTDNRFDQAAAILANKGITNKKQVFALMELELYSRIIGLDENSLGFVFRFRLWHQANMGVNLGDKTGVDLSHLDWPVGEQNKPQQKFVRIRKQTGNMGNVLLIHEHDELRRVYHIRLERDGFTVWEAATLENGRRFINEAEPDIILLDADFPNGSGFDGVKFCAEIRNKTQAHIILQSFNTYNSAVIMGIVAGADDYISKTSCYLAEITALMDKVMLRLEKGQGGGAVKNTKQQQRTTTSTA
jgi:CheY-like chemotaxis protein